MADPHSSAAARAAWAIVLIAFSTAALCGCAAMRSQAGRSVPGACWYEDGRRVCVGAHWHTQDCPVCASARAAAGVPPIRASPAPAAPLLPPAVDLAERAPQEAAGGPAASAPDGSLAAELAELRRQLAKAEYRDAAQTETLAELAKEAAALQELERQHAELRAQVASQPEASTPASAPLLGGGDLMGQLVVMGLAAAAGAAGVGVPAWALWAGYRGVRGLWSWRRRRRAAGQAARPPATGATPAATSEAPLRRQEAGPAGQSTFRAAGAEQAESEAGDEHFPRDFEEAREYLRLAALEGQAPLQDALVGRITLEELQRLIDGDDQEAAELAQQIKERLRDRVDTLAPLTLSGSDDEA